MGFLSRFKPAPAAPVTATATQNDVEAPRAQSFTAGNEKNVLGGTEKTFTPQWNSNTPAGEDSDSDDELVHKNAQWGVQKAEAMCQAWGKKSLYGTYAM